MPIVHPVEHLCNKFKIQRVVMHDGTLYGMRCRDLELEGAANVLVGTLFIRIAVLTAD